MSNLAIYPGSFNPFHLGHKNILEKAKAIFDNVIIAYQQSDPIKDYSNRVIPKYLDDENVIYFNSTLAELINQKGNPTLIRGIRGISDLEAEIKQVNWIKLQKSDLKVIFIPCDQEFVSLSSSDIRKAMYYDGLKKVAEYFIVK